MTADLSELDDFEFRTRWRDMPPEEKTGLPPEAIRDYAERYRELTPWVDGAAGRLPKRGNGETDRFDPGPVPADAAATTNIVDWSSLVGDPPPQEWIIPHWLGWNPTLLAGRGGIGKSLLIQQIGTQLACGLPTWGAAAPPLRVLYWACEDDHDQLWRREHFICRGLKLPFSALGKLYVDARHGLDNTLMATAYGKLMFTPQIEVLREQLNDWMIDVLALDNIGHAFGGNENVRYDVTLFVNQIAGLVKGRKFCPIFMGHPSKLQGSEYSGSTAWENSVRMRWYLDDKLPDSKADPDSPPDPDYRVLAKRKTNYTRLDYVQFHFAEGMMAPEIPETEGGPGITDSIRKQQAMRIIIAAAKRLAEMGLRMTDGVASPQFLPKMAVDYKLAEGRTKRELADAMRAAMLDGKIIKSVVGKYPNRMPRDGLIVQP